MEETACRGSPGAPALTGRLDDLEVLPLDAPQVVEALDPAVGGDRQPPVAAVVRDEHAVFLEALEDRLRVGGETGDVEVLAEAEPLPHPREVLVGLPAGEMGRRVDVGPS